VEESADLPVMELGRPGLERDQGIVAIRSGAKTALTGLLEILEHDSEPVPRPGQQFLLVDSAGKRALVIELTEVAVVPSARSAMASRTRKAAVTRTPPPGAPRMRSCSPALRVAGGGRSWPRVDFPCGNG